MPRAAALRFFIPGELDLLQQAEDGGLVGNPFGADAHLRPDGDGGTAVTAPVEVGPTFFGWLFQLGTQAELVGPEAIRQEFRRCCADVLAQYESAESAEKEPRT